MELGNFNWEKETWDVIDAYLQPPGSIGNSKLVDEQIKSYNDFINNWLPTFLMQNPITVTKQDESRKLSLTILNCSVCRPTRYVNRQGKRPLTPADARSNDYSYMAKLYIDFKIRDENGSNVDEHIETKVCVGGIPAMVRSNVCHLNGRSAGEAATMGECAYDLGGYFIIRGGERVVISQERPSENTIFVFSEANASSSKDLLRAEVKSTVDQRFYPIKPCYVKLSNTHCLRVYLPYGRRPIPIGIIFKAFGVVSDKDIQECLIDLTNPSNEAFVNIIANTLRESSAVLTREDAIRAISNCINILIDPTEEISTGKSPSETDRKDLREAFKLKYTVDLLNRDFLPHVGNQPIKKLRYLSLMTQKLLEAYRDPRLLTDRDSLLSKRLDLVGPLLSQIFRHWFLQLIRDIKQQFARILTDNTNEQKALDITYAQDIRRMIQKNPIEKKLTHALSTGNWQTGRGPVQAAKKGVAQVLQRLSYHGYLSHLCRINSPLDISGSKNVQPRKLHGTQVPKICPAETPEGAQVGTVKNKALLLHVTIETSSAAAHFCLTKLGMIDIADTSARQSHNMTRVTINGDLVGLIANNQETYRIFTAMKYFKLTGTLNRTISISWNTDTRILNVLTDGGRYTIPYYRIDEDNHFVMDHWVKAKNLVGKGRKLTFDEMASAMPADLLEKLNDEDCLAFNRIEAKRKQGDFRSLKQAAIEFLDTDEDSTVILADTPQRLYDGQTFRYHAIDDPNAIGLSSDITGGYFGHMTSAIENFDDLDNDSLLAAIRNSLPPEYVEILDTVVTGTYILDRENRFIVITVRDANLSPKQKVVVINLNRHITGDFIRYTHCMFHPAQIHGVIASNIPFSDHNPSPRNCYQSSMGKQALGIFATNYHIRWDTMANVLTYPQVPMSQTRTAKYVNHDKIFSGYTSMHCICTYTGYNQEDSLIGNKASADVGAFNSLYYRTYSMQLRRITTNGDGEETFEVPPTAGTIGRRMGIDGSDRYHGIVTNANKNGKPELPAIGTILESNDVIIPRTKKVIKDGVLLHSDNSVTVRASERGVVDGLIPSEENPNDENEEGYKIVKVRLVELRQPIIGDKFASMSAQKGTLGIQLNTSDMIKSSISGQPDTIMNPHAIPSRMTMGQLLSAAMSTYGILTGDFTDCTPFTKFDLDDVHRKLSELGYDYGCEQYMYNGWTGDLLGIIYYAATYYQRLKHMVTDKIHGRDSGATQALTRQPAEGRSKGGGLRVGEMERDALIAHGLTALLREKFCEASDIFELYVSPEKHTVVTANPKQGIYTYGTEKVYSDGVKRVIMPYATELFRKELMQSMVKMVYSFQNSEYI
jgi:DNA-directed RNA polymerase beta subunit